MKRLLLLLPFIFIGCDTEVNDVSNRMYLRQLNYTQERHDEEQASFFLLTGDASKKSIEEIKIRVFAEERNVYRLYDLPLNKVSISVNQNQNEKPYMKIHYVRGKNQDKPMMYKLFNDYGSWQIKDINIVVQKQYFPEIYNKISIK